MQILDPAWIGRLSGIGILGGIAALLYLGHWVEKKLGWKDHSRGLGRVMLEVESVLRPSKAYVLEAKEQHRKIEDDEGGPNKSGQRRK